MLLQNWGVPCTSTELIGMLMPASQVRGNRIQLQLTQPHLGPCTFPKPALSSQTWLCWKLQVSSTQTDCERLPWNQGVCGKRIQLHLAQPHLGSCTFPQSALSSQAWLCSMCRTIEDRKIPADYGCSTCHWCGLWQWHPASARTAPWPCTASDGCIPEVSQLLLC